MNRQSVAALALSGAALIGIALHEGFRPSAYDDGVGISTIGFGTTQGVKPGDTITVERALIRLGQDVSRHEAGIRQCLDIPLLQREWDAAVSLAYNIGVSAFCGSTIVKRWKAGDYSGGCEAFLMWNRAGGKVLKGLVKRREAERKTCLGEP
jgi:lysozyme